MQISVMPLGSLGANCYLVADPASGRCAVIDPGDSGDQLAALLAGRGLTLDCILLTHGHFDHVGGVRALQAATGAPVYMSSNDLSLPGQLSSDLPTAFIDLSQKAGSTVTVGCLTFEVLETPGHSPGSVCFLAREAGADAVLFTGDTLFQGSCGRMDFPGGSPAEMNRSLAQLGRLPGNYRVYPGHGGETTLDIERRSNYFLQEALR